VNQAIRPTNNKIVWLDKLKSFHSVQDMRQWLAARDAVFDTGRLKRLAVVGAADEGIRLVDLCGNLGIDVVALCDDNPSKQGVQVGSVMVQPIGALMDFDR